jgi:cyclopropane fatty-acyl-phospholipid synthase-like methyltransferase
MANIWDERYANDAYYYGTEANVFLMSQQHLLKPGLSCLAVADGEGRNGVWLAEQGLQVLSVDGSIKAQNKAKKLAQERAVDLDFEHVDLINWAWPENSFDVVVGIFIQVFADELRSQLFENIKRSLKPGGLFLLQGYTQRQLEFKTGGPSQIENLYTNLMLKQKFCDMELLHFEEHDQVINEGSGHHGMSALIDLVARKT